MILLGFAVLFLAFPVTLEMMTPTQKYPFHKLMNAQGSYHLYWEYDNHMITFEIIANTTGFVGLGWSPKGSMIEADIIVASVDGHGRLTLQDCHGEDKNGRPNCTEESNVELIASNQTQGYTMVKFRRKLETCDNHDLPITSSTMRMMWAMGKSNTLEYHGSNRGTRSLRLLGVDAPYTDLPADYKTVDLVKDKFMMPVVLPEIHLECVTLELPKLKEKHHVIRIETVIQHPEYINYIGLYFCDLELNSKTKLMSSMVNNSYGCDSDKGLQRLACSDVIFVLEEGGENVSLPKEAGIPIGTDDEPYYVRLEVQYSNPNHVRNVIDSSGVRLFYTKSVRQNDASVIRIGKLMNDRHLIPPGQTKFVSNAYTPKQCTGKVHFGVSDNVTAFSVFPHAHYAGIAIRLRLFRNGVELPYLYDDQAYDPHYQNTFMLSKKATIKQGDEFLLECVYNTEDRRNTTLGGVRRMDEMCHVNIGIYPRIPLAMIHSETAGEEVYKLYMENRNEQVDMSHSSIQSNINWGTDGKLAKRWQEIEEKQDKYWGFCVTRGQTLTLKAYGNYHLPPKISHEYKPRGSSCRRDPGRDPVTTSAEKTKLNSYTIIHFAILVTKTIGVLIS